MEQPEVQIRLNLRLAGDGVQVELLPAPEEASGSGSIAAAAVTPPAAQHAPLAPGTPLRARTGGATASAAQPDRLRPPPPPLPKPHDLWKAVKEAVAAAGEEHDLLAFLVWTLAAASRLAQRTGTALAGGGRRAAAGAAAAAQRVRAVGVLQPLRLAAGATWAWASKAVPLPRAALAALLLACLLAPLAAFSAGRWVGSQAHAELPQWPTNLPDASSCTCAGPVAATFLPAPARGDTPAVPLAFSDAPQQAQQATAGPAGQLPEPAASSPELMGPQAADSASGNASMPPRPADGEPPNFAPLEAWLEAEAGGAPPAAAALRVTATRAWAAAASVVRDYWRAQAWVRALAGGVVIPGSFLAGCALRAWAGRRGPLRTRVA